MRTHMSGLACLLFAVVAISFSILGSSCSSPPDESAGRKAAVAMVLDRAINGVHDEEMPWRWRDSEVPDEEVHWRWRDSEVPVIVPGYDLMEDKTNIVLSTDNMPENWVPRLSGVNFILLPQEEIQARADAEGDFLYFRFRKMDIIDESTIETELDCVWAVGKDSPNWYLSGGGLCFRCQKENGQWTCELGNMWIS